MILPTKKRTSARSLIGIGALILGFLNEPRSISNLWWKIRNSRVTKESYPYLDFDQFILSLDFLFLMNIIHFKDNKIRTGGE